MFRYIKVQKGVQLAVALASVILGALMLVIRQKDLPLMIIWAVAAASAVFGTVRLVRWLTGRGDPAQGVSAHGARVRADMWVGAAYWLAAVALGVFADPLSDLIAFVLGAYVALDGLLSLFNAFKLKKLQFAGWKRVLVLAIVPVVLGVLMMVLPGVLPQGANYEMLCNVVLGLGLLVNGGIGLWTVWCLHRGTEEKG